MDTEIQMHREEGLAKTESQMGAMCLQAKECNELVAATSSKEDGFFQGFQKELTKPTH